MFDNKNQKSNSYWAVNYFSLIAKNYSAKNVNYLKVMVGFFMIFTSLILLDSITCIMIMNILYLIQLLFKIIVFANSLHSQKSKSLRLDSNLPIYSILIPLYKEALKIKSILNAMQNITYPKDKLDVKLIIEDDDLTTANAIVIEDLPSYIEVIRVPYSLPRTKPKAMNYAMSYVKGEFLAVYDAEDIPDKDQLLKALYAFRTLPEHYICVQARLNFYNANTNLLTRFFSIEYSLWSQFFLGGLSKLGLPLTLSGTSNHFEVKQLKSLGCWDPYNVTEDAELGIRIYISGYKVHVINSITLEEAPTDIFIWLSQRTRWIKGFMQTSSILIRLRHTKLRIIDLVSTYILVIFSTYSFILIPWLWLLVNSNELPEYLTYLYITNIIINLSLIYVSLYFVSSREKNLRKGFKSFIALILLPFYFILQIISTYRAIYEIIFHPFRWNKTPHGFD